jgi:uncharacterized protein YbjT (DUF2867 family)
VGEHGEPSRRAVLKSSRRTVLLLGASGFIGEHLARALEAAGHELVCGVRGARTMPGRRSVAIDYMRDHAVTDWLPRLQGIDVVINAIGILRETRGATFEAVHVNAPIALFQACLEAGVKKVVQMSALGADAQAVSRYHLSKKRADDALAALPIPWVIVQPSLVFGLGGRSAALFLQLAALPLVSLPGDGGQHVQPVHIDDLTTAIVTLVGSAEFDGERIPVVGPQPATLREFLAALRRGLGLGKPRFVRVPLAIVRAAAALGDHSSAVLLDRESLGMLLRGNVGSAERITAILGRPPRAIDAFIEADRAGDAATQARLSWLLPLLRFTIGIVWIATGIVSLGLFPAEESYAMLARVGLSGMAAQAALYGASLIDLVFGFGVFLMRDRRWLWRAQMALMIAYSVIITIFLPEYWLHPFGPLLKNLPMLAGILLLHEMEKPLSGKPWNT